MVTLVTLMMTMMMMIALHLVIAKFVTRITSYNWTIASSHLTHYAPHFSRFPCYPLIFGILGFIMKQKIKQNHKNKHNYLRKLRKLEQLVGNPLLRFVHAFALSMIWFSSQKVQSFNVPKSLPISTIHNLIFPDRSPTWFSPITFLIPDLAETSAS